MPDSPTPVQSDVAERLARDIHLRQVDKAGRPYIRHIERVVENLLRRWPGATDDEIAAAWLHDAIEDSPWDGPLLLRAGVSPGAVAIVEELTRPKGWAYLDWIRALAAIGGLSAVKVKLADNEDNSDPERVAAIVDGASLLERRYRPAREMLECRIAATARDGADAASGCWWRCCGDGAGQ